MERKIISLDFDDVLWDIQKGVNVYLTEKYGFAPKKEEIPTWEYLLETFPDITNAWGDWFYYSQGAALEGSQEFISNLSDLVGKDSIQIVTASYPTIIEEKNKLIFDLFGIKSENVIHTKDKYLVTKGTILVDDACHNILKHVNNNNDLGILVDFNYGWNQIPIEVENGNIFRAKSYEDILSLLQS